MTRPHVALVDGARRIDWPENSFQHARVAAAEAAGSKDAVLLLGTEPSLRWRAFTALVSGFASELGVSTGGDARLAARRRAAYPALAGHRQRDRQLDARGARPAALSLRGADGRRRGAPRRLPRRGHPLRLALGGGAPLRPADPLAARGEGALRPARLAARGRRSTPPSSTRRARATCCR